MSMDQACRDTGFKFAFIHIITFVINNKLKLIKKSHFI